MRQRHLLPRRVLDLCATVLAAISWAMAFGSVAMLPAIWFFLKATSTQVYLI